MIYGLEYVVYNMWSVICGAEYLVDKKYMIYCIWSYIHGTEFLVDSNYMVYSVWSRTHGTEYLVYKYKYLSNRPQQR